MEEKTYQRLNRTLLSIQNEINSTDEEEHEPSPNVESTEISNLKALLQLFGPAFATRIDFWYSVVFAILFGSLCGIVGLAFFNGFEYISANTWNTDEYQLEISKGTGCKFGAGSWATLKIMVIGGCIIGLIKVAWTAIIGEFPDSPPSLVTEVKDLHVHDPKLSIGLLLCSTISLGIGASVGPEAAAGAIGASLGTYLSSTSFISSRMETSKSFLPFLGIAAAFGPLLPSPILSSMLLHELTIASGSINRFDFMHSIVLSGLAASISYTIFVSLEEFTFLDKNILPVAFYEFPAVQKPDPMLILYAVPIGVICGIYGLFAIFSIGLFKSIASSLFMGCNRIGKGFFGIKSQSCGLFLMPIVGACLIGVLAKYFPLSMGDGNTQLEAVIAQTFNQTINREIKQKLNHTIIDNDDLLTAGDLISISLIKILALGVSLGFGFIGGQLFPLMFSGTCLGAGLSLYIGNDILPIPIAMACCLVSIPCAFTPLVFTLTCTVSMMLALGSAATAPVFVSAFISYATVCGFGIVQRLTLSGIQRKGGEGF